MRCIGLENYQLTLVASCRSSLASFAFCNFHGLGNTTIDVVGGLCRKLTLIDLSGLHRVIDEALIPLVKKCAANLVAVNLCGCVNTTDTSVLTIVKLNGGSIKIFFLYGFRHFTDATLVEILKCCWILNVLEFPRVESPIQGLKHWPVLQNFTCRASHCLVALLFRTIA